MEEEKCHLKKLDDYDINNIDFIKIEVEGALTLISNFKPYILVEVGWGTSHPEWNECERQYNNI